MSCVSCIPSISMSWASCGLLGNFTEKTLNLARNQNIQITTTIKFCIHQFSKNDQINNICWWVCKRVQAP